MSDYVYRECLDVAEVGTFEQFRTLCTFLSSLSTRQRLEHDRIGYVYDAATDRVRKKLKLSASDIDALYCLKNMREYRFNGLLDFDYRLFSREIPDAKVIDTLKIYLNYMVMTYNSKCSITNICKALESFNRLDTTDRGKRVLAKDASELWDELQMLLWQCSFIEACKKLYCNDIYVRDYRK